LFNGNISETLWRTSADNIKRKYTYSYDDLNRLLNADYSKPGLTSVPNNYAESMSYDKNGNITALTRYGDLDSDGMVSANLIDELKYTYDANNANLLKKVLDLSNNPQGFNETADIASGDSDGLTDQTDDYEYDANGNMIKDANKSITSITYNHLNLPINLLFEGTTNGTISYLYNATGQKLRKKVVDATSLNTTDYLNGFQYTNTTLDFFPHAEGYVKYTPPAGRGSGIYSYVFNYTDHLGNIRVSYGKDPSTNVLKVLEENHYYPFGLKHTNYNSDRLIYVKEAEVYKIRPVNTILPTYKYKYNGKELQEELGLNMYDYGARNYDPALGRWMNVDPLAEKGRRWSPYTYAYNNPIFFVDPDGMQTDDWKRDANCNFVFDPNLTAENASTQLKEGEEYVGKSATVSQTKTNSSGNVLDNISYQLNPDGTATNLISGSSESGAIKLLTGEFINTPYNADKLMSVNGDENSASAIPLPRGGAGVAGPFAGALAATYLVLKAAKEIEKISFRPSGSDGFQYALIANTSGYYPVYTLGSSQATSTMYLEAGDVWKYGETTSTDRYSQSYLNSIGAGGVRMREEFYGTQKQIKIAEKAKIYNYFLHNGHLPAGNKIFR
jgi:RHS repeat-associated protein